MFHTAPQITAGLNQVSRRFTHLENFVVRHELYIERTGRGQESRVLDFLDTLLHLQKGLSGTAHSQLRYTYFWRLLPRVYVHISSFLYTELTIAGCPEKKRAAL